MFGALLSNVPLGTANALAYSMILVVALFLVSGSAITYYYWKQNRSTRRASPTAPV